MTCFDIVYESGNEWTKAIFNAALHKHYPHMMVDESGKPTWDGVKEARGYLKARKRRKINAQGKIRSQERSSDTPGGPRSRLRFSLTSSYLVAIGGLLFIVLCVMYNRYF